MIFITRKIQQHREGEGTCIAREKVDSREAVFFMPEFQFRDGIPSLRSHPGVVELTIYCEFSSIYIYVYVLVQSRFIMLLPTYSKLFKSNNKLLFINNNF